MGTLGTLVGVIRQTRHPSAGILPQIALKWVIEGLTTAKIKLATKILNEHNALEAMFWRYDRIKTKMPQRTNPKRGHKWFIVPAIQ